MRDMQCHAMQCNAKHGKEERVVSQNTYGWDFCDVERVFQVLLSAASALHTLLANSMHRQIRLLEVAMITVPLLMLWGCACMHTTSIPAYSSRHKAVWGKHMLLSRERASAMPAAVVCRDPKHKNRIQASVPA